MRESVIKHPRGSRFVALRPHYVEMCDGNVCAAMLLAVFEGWKNWQRQGADYPDAKFEAAEITLRLTMADLHRDLCGGWGKDAIKTALGVLDAKGYLVEDISTASADRAKRWVLHVEVIQGAVNAICGNPQMQERSPANPNADTRDSTRAGDTAVKNERKEPTDVDVVWSYYVEVFSATRQTLDPTRTTIIRNALKVRTIDECKRAIDGLSVSSFHNGDNEQKKKYLGIRYALKGIGAESNDERIDKMIDIADEHGGVLRGGKLPTDHPRVKRHLSNVRTSLRSRTEMARGRESLLALRELGYDVAKLEQAPWVRLIPYTPLMSSRGAA